MSYDTVLLLSDALCVVDCLLLVCLNFSHIMVPLFSLSRLCTPITFYRHNFNFAHSGGLNGATYTDHTGLMVSQYIHLYFLFL